MADLNNITRRKGLTRTTFLNGKKLQKIDFQNSIDIIYERPMFGKVNLKGNAIVLSEINLKQLRTRPKERTFFAVDFVADAFEAMKVYYNKAFKRKKLKQNSMLRQMKPLRAWESINFSYHEHILTLYKGFFEVFIKITKQEKQIISFETFLQVYGQYLENFLDTMPMTKTGFVLSQDASIHFSGLAIDVFPANNKEVTKNIYDFASDPNFPFFLNACKKFGFRVDKHAPYRIIADIYSPNMKKWMKPYGLTPEKFLKEYYYEAYKYDVSSLAIYLKDFYNSYISTWPYINETHGYSKSITKKGFYKDLKTKNCLVARKPINPLEYQKRYGPSTLWMLRAYTIIRGFEAKANWSKLDYQRKIQRSMQLSKIFDYNKAISYINPQIRKEQVKMINGELGRSLMFANPSKKDITAVLNKQILNNKHAIEPSKKIETVFDDISIFHRNSLGWKKSPISDQVFSSVYDTFRHCKSCKPGELYHDKKIIDNLKHEFTNPTLQGSQAEDLLPSSAFEGSAASMPGAEGSGLGMPGQPGGGGLGIPGQPGGGMPGMY